MFGVKLFPVYPSPNIELLVGGDNLLSNHGNQHLDITYQPHNHGYFVTACLQGIHYYYNQNDP